MIRSIEIQRLRGIREGKLEDLTPLTVLVGPNGCGKSTVLDALLIGASPEPGQGIGRAVSRREGLRDGARWLVWRSGRDGDAAAVATTSDGSERAVWVSPAAKEPGGEAKLLFGAGEPNGRPSLGWEARFRPDGRFSATGVSRPLGEVADVRLVDVHAADLRPALPDLVTAAVEEDRIAGVLGMLREVVHEVADIRVGTDRGQPVVHLLQDGGSVPAALSGDGVYSLLRLCLELHLPAGSVALLEEPETHLHPGAMWQTGKLIWAATAAGVQVILTTHSLELIDVLLTVGQETDPRPLSVYRLWLRPDGELVSKRWDSDAVADGRGIIEEDLR